MSFKKRVTKSIALALVGVTIAIPMLNTASAMENSKETYSQKIERVSKSFEDFVYLEDNQYKLDISVSELSESSKSDFYIYNDYINLLNNIPNLQIETNKKWGTNGEFDIIAYDNSNNNILHFQAKASIPVEGARMTQNLESRIEEGIRQIERFNQQDSITKDSIVSKIFNKEIKNPKYIDIIVGWGGFGTYNIWESFNDKKITALNIAVLNQYIIKYNNAYNISNFYNDINNLINEIVDSSSPKKIINKLKIGRYKIYYDSFDYQKAKLLKYRYIPS